MSADSEKVERLVRGVPDDRVPLVLAKWRRHLRPVGMTFTTDMVQPCAWRSHHDRAAVAQCQ
jgi:hypothetical protein